MIFLLFFGKDQRKLQGCIGKRLHKIARSKIDKMKGFHIADVFTEHNRDGNIKMMASLDEPFLQRILLN